jgi:chemotaxis protein MotB
MSGGHDGAPLALGVADELAVWLTVGLARGGAPLAAHAANVTPTTKTPASRRSTHRSYPASPFLRSPARATPPTMTHATMPFALALALASTTGCYKLQYEAATKDAKSARDALTLSQQQHDTDAAKLTDLQKQLSDLQTTEQGCEQKTSELSTSSSNLQAQLDETTAINDKMRSELERLGKNVDQILKEKGVLAQSLTDLKGRLDDLRKAQAAADARAKLFQDFVKKFKSMVDAGELKIVTRRGRLVLQLPNDVLFDSGAAEVKPQGKVAIAQIAKALASLGDRQFQVDGNTDNVPMNGGRNATNWELSTSRALSVLKLLIADGVPPKGLSAAGYGEFDPIAPNDTADGRAKNRRIEITLQPNIDELVGAPALAGADGK